MSDALVRADYNGWDVFYSRTTGFYSVAIADGERYDIGSGTALDKFFFDFSVVA